MAAEKGNKYALGNKGGRPLIYDGDNEEDVFTVENLCEDYFTWIRGEYEEIINPDEPEDITVKTIRKPEPPSVTGLTLHLGFESKSTLYDYSKKDMFSHSIKRALTKIEQYHEFRVGYGDKCIGNIFILKNLGWKDSVTTEHSGEIKTTAPTIVFKKYDDNGD